MLIGCGRIKIPWVGKSVVSGFLLLISYIISPPWYNWNTVVMRKTTNQGCELCQIIGFTFMHYRPSDNSSSLSTIDTPSVSYVSSKQTSSLLTYSKQVCGNVCIYACLSIAAQRNHMVIYEAFSEIKVCLRQGLEVVVVEWAFNKRNRQRRGSCIYI